MLLMMMMTMPIPGFKIDKYLVVAAMSNCKHIPRSVQLVGTRGEYNCFKCHQQEQYNQQTRPGQDKCKAQCSQ